MLILISILWLSVVAGYALRRHPFRQSEQVTQWTVYLLLFLIGKEVGENPAVMQGLGRIGGEALVLTLLTAACCAGGAATAQAFLRRRQQATETTGAATEAGKACRAEAVPIRTQLCASLIIVSFFALGCIVGYNGWCTFLPRQGGFYALCLLLACVGFGLGQNQELRQHLRHMDRRLLALPLLTIACTWAGSALTALALPRYGLADWLAVGSGFGYYSLSSILITELRHAELGTLALMYNIFRELIVLLAAPFLCRFFGPLAPICQGGATSGDTTLPVIVAACGRQYAPLSIYHGICVDFTVPFLVPFFCSWA